MTIEIVLVLFGVVNVWSASPDPDPLDSLRLKEECIAHISGGGKITESGPIKGTDVISKLEFVFSKEREYQISKTTGGRKAAYWSDGHAYYEQTGGKTEIYSADEGASQSIYIRWMLFPWQEVLSPILKGSDNSRLVSEESAQGRSKGKRSYRYVVEDSEETQYDLTLEFGEDTELERIRVTDSTSSSMALVYEYSDYVGVGEGRKLPKYFRTSLQQIGSGNLQFFVEVKLDSVEIPSASPEFSPDLEGLGKVTDYREGIPWIKKESSDLLEQMLDSFPF